jgi:hypothetical protein
LPKAGYAFFTVQLSSHAEALIRLGFEVEIVATEETFADTRKPMETPIPDTTVCGAPYYGSAEEVLRRNAGCFDVVYVLTSDLASFYVRLARRLNPRGNVIFSPGYFIHPELMRRARLEDRPDLMQVAINRRLDELLAVASADVTVVGSAVDQSLIRKGVPGALSSLVHFGCPRRTVARPAERGFDLAVLAGREDSFDFECARYVVEEVLPMVWRLQPDTQCLLVGYETPAWAVKLVRPRVTTVNRTYGDGAAILGRVALTLAPYEQHAGLSPEVLDSFAAGIPCLMTPIVAEGLSLPIELDDLICRDPQEFADRVTTFGDPERYDSIVMRMSEFMTKSFDPADVQSSFSQIIFGNT